MPTTTDLTIIILNYNAQYWLKKTLKSLVEQYLNSTRKKVQVVVVDNNSQDGSAEIVAKEFKLVKLYTLDKNNGFAAGNNVALADVTSKYVMLLNSDMELTPASNLDHLIEYLDANLKTAVITPKITLFDGSLDPACHRGEPTPWASLTYFIGLEKLFPKIKLFSQYHQSYKSLSTTHEIDACSGAAMMVRVSDIKKVGVLDEQFFMYAEDLDWCRRFRLAGKKITFYPAVVIIHHKYKSGLSSLSKQTARKTQQHFYDTMLQYYDKHYQALYPAWIRKSVRAFIFLKKGGV
ncbi:MAG: glycosyltransferase family 2 protein [bacterium]|nr:glycosyltransferase family 2 protein [bacterium]